MNGLKYEWYTILYFFFKHFQKEIIWKIMSLAIINPNANINVLSPNEHIGY